jgi:hypothetical protein
MHPPCLAEAFPGTGLTFCVESHDPPTSGLAHQVLPGMHDAIGSPKVTEVNLQPDKISNVEAGYL